MCATDIPLASIPSLVSADTRNAYQAKLRNIFRDHIYGPLPPAAELTVQSSELQGSDARRLNITLTRDQRTMNVDAAVWKPNGSGPHPVIIVLDFLGPVGLMQGRFPIDTNAVITVPEGIGGGDHLRTALRGQTGYRVPIQMLTDAGYAVVASCYGSWVPDCPGRWRDHGAYPFNHPKTGAISLWAWAYARLIDVAETHLSASDIYIAGHSRLGKAALWAAAHDARIKAVFANQSGCFGAAPFAHPIGETPQQLINRFPHWTITSANDKLSIDQHQLMALVAPRGVYLGLADDDIWADPMGSLAALNAALPAWGDDRNWRQIGSAPGQSSICSGRVGYHLRSGGHDITPDDWNRFLAYLDHADLRDHMATA